MKTIKYTNEQIERMTQEIIRQITLSRYKPDYVVGITRGGLLPALLISQYYNVPMETLRVSLRDHAQQECNAWMPEDAFGYLPIELRQTEKSRWDVARRRKILIVDDINDTGATFEWIKKDWESSCLPDERYAWDSIWNHTVKFAVLVNNEASEYKSVDYLATTVNKAEDDCWIQFPWERWWI
jgi:hypoxanthine phosphoribosyltransferase